MLDVISVVLYDLYNFITFTLNDYLGSSIMTLAKYNSTVLKCSYLLSNGYLCEQEMQLTRLHCLHTWTNSNVWNSDLNK